MPAPARLTTASASLSSIDQSPPRDADPSGTPSALFTPDAGPSGSHVAYRRPGVARPSARLRVRMMTSCPLSARRDASGRPRNPDPPASTIFIGVYCSATIERLAVAAASKRAGQPLYARYAA